MESLGSELVKGNSVIIDTRRMSTEHQEELRLAINNASIGGKILWFRG